MKFSNALILPSFPRTPHLPYNPNAAVDDVIAEASEASVIFGQPINIEEKIDGASVGIALHDGHPIIRNRDRILSKGCSKNTAAKKQFSTIWNWFYEHKNQFEALAEFGDYSIYGEWCVAQHGIYYSNLPDWFIAYDLYDYSTGQFISPPKTRQCLTEAGFSLPRLFHQGRFDGLYDEIAVWLGETSEFSEAKVEGLYIKSYNTDVVTHRFKVVRPDFQRGQFWDMKQINRNKIGN